MAPVQWTGPTTSMTQPKYIHVKMGLCLLIVVTVRAGEWDHEMNERRFKGPIICKTHLYQWFLTLKNGGGGGRGIQTFRSALCDVTQGTKTSPRWATVLLMISKGASNLVKRIISKATQCLRTHVLILISLCYFTGVFLLLSHLTEAHWNGMFRSRDKRLQYFYWSAGGGRETDALHSPLVPHSVAVVQRVRSGNELK